jgi:hypothetical protein
LKKLCFFTLLLCSALIISANAQSTSAAGYGAIPWGASISEVLAVYPNANLRPRTLAFDLHNLRTDLDFSAVVKCYMESSVDARIKSRNFYFYQDMLICVMEHIPENASFEATRTGLENIYGRFIDFSPEANKLPLGITVTLNGCSKTVNKDHAVELDRLEFRGLMTGRRTEIMVRYSDPNVLKQIIERE